MTISMNYNPAGYMFKQVFDQNGRKRWYYYIPYFNGQLVSVYEQMGNKLKLNYKPIFAGTKRIRIIQPEDVKEMIDRYGFKWGK